MQLTRVSDGRHLDFAPQKDIGFGCHKTVVGGMVSDGKTAMQSVLAFYKDKSMHLAKTLESKHRALQDAGVPTFEYCHVVETTRGQVGALLPNLNQGGLHVLSLSDCREDRPEEGNLVVPPDTRGHIIEELHRIARLTTRASVRMWPDAPFYRLRTRGGKFFIHDVLLGDLDDAEPSHQGTNLLKHNARVLLGNFEDLLEVFAKQKMRIAA